MYSPAEEPVTTPEQQAAVPRAAETAVKEQEPPAFSVKEIDVILYALNRSNVRAGPGTNYGKMHRLDPGDEVDVTGKIEGKD